MGAIIFIIFAIVVSLSFLENSLKESTKRNAYWFFAVVLVLVAGLREVGVDPDSVNLSMLSIITMTTVSPAP